jgi:trimeric autotransporter adhesin
LKQPKKHLNVATVLSFAALFMALSGAAYAATAMLPKKSVKTAHLANGSVTTLKLRNAAVTNLKLRNGAVTGVKIAPATIGSSQLANGSVRSGQLGGGVVTEGKLKNGAVIENKLGASSVATGKLQDGAVTAGKVSSSLLGQMVKNASYVTASSVSNTSEAKKTVTVSCPSGKQVVGGGAKVVGGDALIAITESAPTPPNSEGKRTGWSVSAAEASASTVAWSVEVYATCAEF